MAPDTGLLKENKIKIIGNKINIIKMGVSTTGSLAD